MLSRCLLWCVLLAPVAVLGATFEDARSAYDAGHLHAARQILRQLGSSEDPRISALQARIDDDLSQSGASGVVTRAVPAAETTQAYRTEPESHRRAPGVDQISVAPGSDQEAQVNKVELVYAQLQEKLAAQQQDQQETQECLTNAAVQQLIETERRAAAESAMQRAEAIAAATAERQRRAVERMRAQITAQVTRKVRAELDSQFDREVQARVEAILRGRERAVRPSGYPSAQDAS